MTHPEVLCLDATDERTWRRFELWRDALEDDLEMDRTEMYRQREERKAFVKEEVVHAPTKKRLLKLLECPRPEGSRSPARAAIGDLKRVVEAHQSDEPVQPRRQPRTTFREAQAWQQSADHVVLLGQTSDRFGEMGTTCVAVARLDGGEMHLLPFVLSCRVFGYGIERGVMNHLKALAAKAGVKRVVGRYLPTPQNAPCKDFLADSGFEETDGRWIFSVDAAASTSQGRGRLQVAVA